MGVYGKRVYTKSRKLRERGWIADIIIRIFYREISKRKREQYGKQICR